MTTRNTSARGTKKQTATWNPGSKLRTPTPRTGYAQRWINSDESRLEEAMAEGYSLVERAEGDRKDPLGRDLTGDKAKYYIYKDLVLAEIPLDLVAARTEYYAQEAAGQMDYVKEQLHNKSTDKVGIL